MVLKCTKKSSNSKLRMKINPLIMVKRPVDNLTAEDAADDRHVKKCWTWYVIKELQVFMIMPLNTC